MTMFPLNVYDTLSVTSHQSPVTSNEQCSVAPNQSKVNNLCMTARDEDEKTTLVTERQRVTGNCLTEKYPSHSSHSSPVRVTEDHQLITTRHRSNS